ncbi:hypothetical protein CWN98_07175 [Vibrio splendidus]|uniref:AAA family ATPase n=1 Tax=Vibrio splendidus TaxID=29497 RepID=UPI000D374846|nr:AAA family ATPase [Vibrio splendidus]PTO88671.1 hypothetical protein CWN98_07175 [Vibrio splendidus]PTP49138.1 hypothetical protein CWO10_06145 [Vibrio splendidus]
MNNQSIKFLSVTIQNFRGVPENLTIPLDAPLTVIHAANGTGKSTICYALEWLITGKVEDLPNTTDFACQWGSGDTIVYAECLIDNEKTKITRKGRSVWIEEGNNKKVKIKEADLLSRLTPDSVSGSSVQATSKAKRGWLRNSRWLYSNSLSLLVDNNKAEERQKIFADILGLGHLADKLRELKEYRKQLPSTSGVLRGIKSLDDRIRELEENQRKNSPLISLATNNVNLVLREFPDLKPTNNLKEDFNTARLQVNLLDEKLIYNSSTLNYLYSQWDQYQADKSQENSLKKSIFDLSEANATYTKSNTDLYNQLSPLDVKRAEGVRSSTWANEHLEGLARWEKILKTSIFEEYISSKLTSEKNLKDNFVEFSWSKEQQEGWLDSINFLLKNISTIEGLVTQRKNLLSNKVLLPVDLNEKQINAQKATENRISAESEFNAVTGIHEKLISTGLDIISSNKTSQCPLCEANWETPSILEQQIRKQDVLTAATVEASRKVSSEKNNEANAMALFTAANNQKKAHDSQLAQLTSIDTQLSKFDQQSNYLNTMGFRDFSQCGESNLVHLKNRVNTAIDLRIVFHTLETIESVFQNLPSPNLQERVGIAENNLINYKQHYTLQRTTAESEISSLTTSINANKSKVEITLKEIADKNSHLERVSYSTNKFESKWKSVTSEEISIDFESLNSEITKNFEVMRKVESLTSLLTESEVIANLESESVLAKQLISEKEELSKKLAIGNSHLNIADDTIESFEKYVRELTSANLAPILTPASELFSRMHANEVYKSLNVSDNQELTWTVVADELDFELDAEERLSQGQRQDLALSLYLARARNTGGSFFLDEPIAHLDDLNKVAMLDILRLFASSMPNMNLVLTTASESLARHLSQKFSSVTDKHLLNMIHLEGNPRTGISMSLSSNTNKEVARKATL